MKLYYISHEGCKAPPLLAFLETLEQKQRQKLLTQFSMLLASSVMPREPTVKSFSLEKYSTLFELRARSKIMIRIIFTVREDGGILFLTPFVKKQTRDTMSALDASLKQLAQIKNGTYQVSELTKNMIMEMNARDKNTG